MYFCEKCNAVMQDTTCTACGKRRLREVQPDDFCHYISLPAYVARMFEETLKDEGVPVALLGMGGFLTSAKTSARYKIYVPYKYFDKAREVYEAVYKTLDSKE